MIKIIFEQSGQRKQVFQASNGLQVSSILKPTRNVEYYKFLMENLHHTNDHEIGDHLVKYLHKQLGIKGVKCSTISELNNSLKSSIDDLFELAKKEASIKGFINANFNIYETNFKMRTGTPLMIIAPTNECEELPTTFKTKKMKDGNYCYYDYRIKNDDVYKLYNAVASN